MTCFKLDNHNGFQEQFEVLIQGILSQQFGICNSFFDEFTATGLRKNLLEFHNAGLMKKAGIGKNFDYQENIAVRGDVIKWIDKESQNLFEKQFLKKIETFINYLNTSCYAGINDYEFHYAYYEQGSFYKKHLDQFKSDKGRKFSLVTYLNSNWQLTDGGNLVIYSENLPPQSIIPTLGTTVFFNSSKILHEVKPSPTRYRLSIAGWLKSV